MKNQSREQITMRVSFVSIGGNLFLCFLKLMAGILGRSGALISDAVHSAADAVDTIIVIIGIKVASRAPDSRHPYGHERMECVAAIILSIILGVVGVGIGYAGLDKILSRSFENVEAPSMLAAAAALVAIAIKEGLYWYMRSSAKKINSDSLMAIAWHNRADALSSIGSFIGILGARAGLAILDPLVSVIICLFVIKAALSIFMGAINKMVDQAYDPQIAEKIRAAAESYSGLYRLGTIRTRIFGDKIYVEMKIHLPGETTLQASTDLCFQLRQYIESQFDEVKECRVLPAPEQK